MDGAWKMSGYDDLFKSHFPDRDSTPQGGTKTGSTGRGSNTGTRQYDSYESLRRQYFGNSGTSTRRERNTGSAGQRTRTSTRVTVRPEVEKPKKGSDWAEKTGKTALSMLPDKGKFASEQTRARMNDPEAHYTDKEWTLPTGMAGGAALSAMTGARASALKTDPAESRPVSMPKEDGSTGALGRAARDPDFVGPLPPGTTRGTARNAQQRAQAHAQIVNDAYTAQQNTAEQYQDTQKKAAAAAERAARILAESGAVQNGDGSFTFPNAASARMFTKALADTRQYAERGDELVLEYYRQERTRRAAASKYQKDVDRYNEIIEYYDADSSQLAQSAGTNGYKMPGYFAAEDKEEAQTNNALAKLAREAAAIYEKRDAKTSDEGVESLGEDGRRLYNAGKIIAEEGTPRDELSDAQREALDLYEKYRPDRADIPLTTEEQETLERYEYAVSSWTAKQVAEAKAQPDFAAKSKPQSAPGTIDPAVFWRDLNEAERVSAMVDGDEIGSWLHSDAPLDYVGHLFSSENATEAEWYAYRMMSDDEKDTFRYLWNTKGQEAALGFAKLLKPKLNRLYANEAMDTRGTWGKIEDQTIGSVAQGTNKAMRGLSYGIGKLFGADQPMPDEGGAVAQYRGMLHEDPVTIGGTGFEKALAGAGMSAAESAGQMLPAIAASVAGQGISAALAGSGALSVGGSLAHQAAVSSAIAHVPQAAFSSAFYTEIFSQNYIDGRRQGMDETQASIYGGLTATSEVATQTLLGYVPGLQGVMSENFGNMLAEKFKSAAMKTVMQWVGRVSGEVIEENFQNAIEPLIKAVATQQAPEFWGSAGEFFDEFLETTVSTLMLTTAMSAGDTVSDYVGYRAQEQETLRAQVEWAQEAMKAPEGSAIYKAGEAVIDAVTDGNMPKKPMSEYDFLKIVNSIGAEYDAEVAAQSAENVEAVPEAAQRTVEAPAEAKYAALSGVSPEQAQQAAETLNALKTGEKSVRDLTNAEILNLRLNTPEGRAIASEAFGVQIEAPSGISGMRRALLDAVEAGKNVQLNIDNAENSGYTEENGGVSNDGNRMAGGMAEGVPERQDTRGKRAETWRDGRTDQVLSRRNLSQSVQNAFTESGVVAAELYDFDADNAAFSSALDAARAADADHGWAVTPQSSAELQGKRTFMDEGGTIGFALTDDGDIEAVFKNKQLNKTPHAMDGVIPQAIADGGKKLDCYGEKLVSIYEDYGFVPVARVEFNEQYANDGWDASKGTPYVYFMMHNGDSAETVVSNIGEYGHMTQEQLDALPTYGKDGYDQATAYRDSLLSDRKSALASVNNDGGDSGGGGNGTESSSPSNDHEKRESKFVENTLKNSPVFGGVFQDVRDEMLEQNKNAARYNVSHEVDSMAEAADRIQADPKGEAEYLLTDNDGHVWSAPDIDTAMGLIASNQLDGNEARAVELALAVKEAGTQAGQTVQALAKWSRTPQGAAVDAITELNDGRFSHERVAELGGQLLDAASRIQAASDALRNPDTGEVQGRGDAAMIGVITDLAKLRKTTTMFTDKLGRIVSKSLRKLPNDVLQKIAVSQIRGVSSDLTRKSTKADIASALLRLNDLSAPATFNRNLVGNAMFGLVDSLANNVAVPIDNLLYLVTGRRTLSADISLLSRQAWSTAIRAYRQAYVETALDVNTDGLEGKYGQTTSRVFKANGNVVERVLSRMEEIQAHLLVDSDEFFKGFARGEVLRGMAKLVEQGKISPEDALKAADLMALERTFQQDSVSGRFASSIKNALNQVGFSGNSGVVTVKLDNGEKVRIEKSKLGDADYRRQIVEAREGKEARQQMQQLIKNLYDPNAARFGVGNMLLNYTTVAGALVDLAVKYEAGSVLGLAGLINTLRLGKDVSFETQRSAALTFGRGITGASMTYAFSKLAQLGILIVAGVGDDDDRKRDTQRGVQHLDGIQLNWDGLIRLIKGEDATLQDGDTLLDLSFMQPLDAMMQTGAMMANSETALEAFPNGIFASIANTPGLEQLGSIYKTLTGYSGDVDASKFTELGKQLLLDSVSRVEPAILRAFAKAGDPYYRDLYTSDSFFGQMKDRLQYGIPGWRNQLPVKTDAYGQAKEYGGSTAMRIANALLLPGKIEQYSTGRASEEAERLYQATGESVFPSTAVQNTHKWKDRYGKEQEYTLTAGEKSEFRTMRGQTYEAMQLDLMDTSEEWAEMTDDERVEVLQDVSKIATEYARAAVIKGYRSSNKEYNLMVKAGLDYSDVLSIKTVREKCEALTDSVTSAQTHFRTWLDAQDWTPGQKKAIQETYGTYWTMAPANTDKYDALAPQIGADAAMDLTDKISGLEPAEGHSGVSDWQKIAAIATSDLSETEQWAAIGEYTDDWRAAAFRDAGISPAAYAGYKRARSESSKAVYAWLDASGYSKEVKDKIRRIASAKNKDAYYG
nr:MAG TPA: hypothetical protein [Caudoviricetes sp.]